MTSNSKLRRILAIHRPALEARANVIGTHIGYKWTAGKTMRTCCIVCDVSRKLPMSALAAKDLIPRMIDGVLTDVQETGVIRALAFAPQPAGPIKRHRPAPGGVSIGHRDITAGTLACLLTSDNGERVILSNAHVLANSNMAEIGDPILQPGPHDGGVVRGDTIAALLDYVHINFLGSDPSDCRFAAAVIGMLNLGCRLIGSITRYQAVRPRVAENLVDAAIALPLAPEYVADHILGLGPINGTADAALGMRVVKAGRTTGITRGEVTGIDATVQVQYGLGQVAVFTDQLLIGPAGFSAGGDSGSAVLDEHNRLIGLLFAGSEQVTIINRAAHVLAAFRATRGA